MGTSRTKGSTVLIFILVCLASWAVGKDSSYFEPGPLRTNASGVFHSIVFGETYTQSKLVLTTIEVPSNLSHPCVGLLALTKTTQKGNPMYAMTRTTPRTIPNVPKR